MSEYMNKKRAFIFLELLLVFFIIFLLFTTLSKEVNATETNSNIVTEFHKGTGYAENPFQISTADELFLMSELINSGSSYSIINGEVVYYVYDVNDSSAQTIGDRFFQDACYALTNDIYLNDVSSEEWDKSDSLNLWTPIGYQSVKIGGNDVSKFTGEFNGNNYNIYGVYINEELDENISSENYIGFFGNVSDGAIIQNLNLVDLSVSVSMSNKTYMYVSTVAGRINNSLVLNVHASGTLNTTHKSNITNDSSEEIVACGFMASGFVGYNYGGTIVNSGSTVSINGSVSGTSNIAVISGFTTFSQPTSKNDSGIINCYFDGKMNVENNCNATVVVIGLVGQNNSEGSSSTYHSYIINSYACFNRDENSNNSVFDIVMENYETNEDCYVNNYYISKTSTKEEKENLCDELNNYVSNNGSTYANALYTWSIEEVENEVLLRHNNLFTVSFVTSIGSGIASITNISSGELISAPNISDVPGYEFVGWYKEEELINEWDFSTDTVDSSIVLYAKWELASSTVSFETNGGTSIDAITALSGTSYTIPNNPVKEHYEFGGWYLDANFNTLAELGVMTFGDTTYYAKWIPKNYLVSFDSNGGEGEMDSIYLPYGISSDLPEINYTKEGYDFVGFSEVKDGAIVTVGKKYTVSSENQTLYAKWTPKSYTITFVTNGGNAIGDITQAYLSEITFPNAYRKGYTFLGFYVNSELTEEATFTKMPLGGATLYLKWQINEYTITFNTNGGNTMDAITLDYNGVINIADPSKKGYTFNGWYLDNKLQTKFNLTNMPDYDISLYASWRANQENIIFIPNGAIEDSYIQVVEFATTTNLVSCKFNRTGYTFMGWSTSSDGEIIYYDGDSISMTEEGITLYAIWEINEYTITFNTNGGTEINAITKKYQDEIFAPEDPQLIGHKFSGWYSDENLTIGYTFDKMGAQDITLYAKWEVQKYQIIFDANGGTEVQTIEQYYGSIVNEPVTTKKGYTFLGWYEDGNDNPYIFSTVEARNISLTAYYSVNSYDVTFNSNNNLGDISTQTIVYNEEATLNYNTFIYIGYTFMGWSTSSNGEVEYVDGALLKMTEEGFTLYAVWKINEYTITFNTNGGTDISPIILEFNAEISNLTTPIKTGYTFVGYYLDEELQTEFILTNMPAHNITLYARFETNCYNVIYNANGGLGSDVSQEIYYNMTKRLLLNEFTYTGYTFKG